MVVKKAKCAEIDYSARTAECQKQWKNVSGFAYYLVA